MFLGNPGIFGLKLLKFERICKGFRWGWGGVRRRARGRIGVSRRGAEAQRIRKAGAAGTQPGELTAKVAKSAKKYFRGIDDFIAGMVWRGCGWAGEVVSEAFRMAEGKADLWVVGA